MNKHGKSDDSKCKLPDVAFTEGVPSMSRRSIGPGVSFFAFQDIITAVVGIFILITLTLILELNQRVESASEAPDNATPIIDEQKIISIEQQSTDLQLQYDLRLQQLSEMSEITVLNRDQKMEEANAARIASKQQFENLQNMVAEMDVQQLNQDRINATLESESNQLSAQRKQIEQLETILAKLANQKNQIKGKEGLLYRDQVDTTNFVCLIQLNDAGVTIKDAASQTVKRLATARSFKSWLQTNTARNRHFLLLIEPSGIDFFETIREELQDANAIYGFDPVESGH